MKTKQFYEAPGAEVIQLRLEGMIALSDSKSSSLTNYNAANVFGGEDQDDQDW